jgi:hypothetical protein
VATAFGMLVLVATLPGAVLLLAGRLRPRLRSTRPRSTGLRSTRLRGTGTADGERLVARGLVRSGAREDGALHG